MEKNLLRMDPVPTFPGKIFYKHKDDEFICTDHLGGPEFWGKHGNDFEARKSDIYIASYPRTGTTWTAELVYLIANDFDYEKAKSLPSRLRTPYLNFAETAKEAYDIESPRCIRTHLPYVHLPKSIIEKKCKIIYTIRNPKDALVSYYNFGLMNKYVNYVGNFNQMFDLFMEEKLPSSPFWKHVLQYWNHRNEDNVFIISFEERKIDLSSSIRKLAKFLGKEVTDDQVHSLSDFCSFSSMKSNPSVNLEDATMFDKSLSTFIRKGEVGDWKNYFSKEQSQLIDEYVKKHFAGSGLEFVYEL